MERIRKIISWVALGVCTAGLLVSAVGHCEEQETTGDGHFPIGSRSAFCALDVGDDVEATSNPAQCSEQEDCDCGCLASGEPFNLNMCLSAAVHPGTMHQIVECLPGPVAIPLVDGRVYVLPAGLYVRLEDTSIWRIMDADIWAMQDWLPSDSLQLMTNPTWFSTPFRYSLCNLNTQVQVRICPEVGPRVSWSLRRYIYDRSLITNELILNDGSLWRVTSADAAVFANWLPDDSVIIGVNSDWMSYRRPNIMINLTTNDYVRCSWLR